MSTQVVVVFVVEWIYLDDCQCFKFCFTGRSVNGVRLGCLWRVFLCGICDKMVVEFVCYRLLCLDTFQFSKLNTMIMTTCGSESVSRSGIA